MGNSKDKEETARRKVLKGLVELRNIHKIAAIVIWTTKSGPVFFGTDILKAKAKTAFECTCECSCNANNSTLWPQAIQDDEDGLCHNADFFDPGMDLVDFMKLDVPVPKIPMRLDLMCFHDLANNTEQTGKGIYWVKDNLQGYDMVPLILAH